ncbi:SWI/SNF-related matrix-associated actin-dependent regulator of chromatin subfamily E member 1-related-like, partial [Papio anubis]|uniref:SWI/SNF-related matrix-associated actin-dependent regulator of chromatin subfamily E member 1-related-like n=1 Tax=Papio anubis TaxID=9555 RepID=UPI0012ADDA26
PSARATRPESPPTSAPGAPARDSPAPLPHPLTCPPGTGETPTLGTLDFYMARLHGAIERDPAQHEKLIVRIKEILAQVASEHL